MLASTKPRKRPLYEPGEGAGRFTDLRRPTRSQTPPGSVAMKKAAGGGNRPLSWGWKAERKEAP